MEQGLQESGFRRGRNECVGFLVERGTMLYGWGKVQEGRKRSQDMEVG